MKTAEAKELEVQLKEATKLVKEIKKQMNTKDFKSMTKYSQNLVNDEYKEAISKQFDIIEKIVELGISEKESIALVKRATK